jgi:hypothetical protein
MLLRKTIALFFNYCETEYTVRVERKVSGDQNRQYIFITAFSYVSGISARYPIIYYSKFSRELVHENNNTGRPIRVNGARLDLT